MVLVGGVGASVGAGGGFSSAPLARGDGSTSPSASDTITMRCEVDLRTTIDPQDVMMWSSSHEHGTAFATGWCPVAGRRVERRPPRCAPAPSPNYFSILIAGYGSVYYYNT